LKGFKIKSTSFWEVSTFPPTTAASLEGDRILFSGIIIVSGAKQPELSGIY
jgi:hypothetical protein